MTNNTMTNNTMTNNNQAVYSKLMIVTDPVDLYYGKNPIECEVNSFLRGIFGDSVEADEIVTISYLLNIVEVKMDLTAGTKSWNFLAENIEQVKTILEGITLEADSSIYLTTYDSILSVLMTMVSKVVSKFVFGKEY